MIDNDFQFITNDLENYPERNVTWKYASTEDKNS